MELSFVEYLYPQLSGLGVITGSVSLDELTYEFLCTRCFGDSAISSYWQEFIKYCKSINREPINDLPGWVSKIKCSISPVGGAHFNKQKQHNNKIKTRRSKLCS